ncbi:hypothetical protein [Sporosarcina sp. Te-1]|uniref:hypothetical protein n=1 Tax=Sporosarcina sp. Te-1 TaxID=2818390 RepID=UPI001A9D6F92|nr:hypothetical protein [Sporosarcina sp. Te-1]QTD40615.1 hypothetical protein J3U78_17905 [Sporosarcina sp. Te-1]
MSIEETLKELREEKELSRLHIDMLGKLSSSKNIRKLRGPAKRFYKLYLIKMFADAVYNNYSDYKKMEKFLHDMLADKGDTLLKQMRGSEKRDDMFERDILLLQKTFLFKISDGNLDRIIEFIRSYSLNYLTSEKTLYKYKDLKFFIMDIHFYDIAILPHWWIDLNPFIKQPTITFPEYFAYQDIINLWNDVLDKEERMYRMRKDKGLSLSNREYRCLNHSSNTTLRMCLIAATNFVEGYLLYYFYNVKSMNKYPGNSLVKETKIRKINDKRIYKELIKKEYTSQVGIIDPLYKKYEEMLDLRDRIVHLSAFKDDEVSHSQMQPLISISIDKTAEMLSDCVDLVLSIEGMVEEKLLFWWDSMEYPDFKSYKRISNLKSK